MANQLWGLEFWLVGSCPNCNQVIILCIIIGTVHDTSMFWLFWLLSYPFRSLQSNHTSIQIFLKYRNYILYPCKLNIYRIQVACRERCWPLKNPWVGYNPHFKVLFAPVAKKTHNFDLINTKESKETTFFNVFLIFLKYIISGSIFSWHPPTPSTHLGKILCTQL